MEQQDLLASATIDQDFPGNHRIATRFFYIAQSSEIQDVDAIQWADTKGKGKTRAKKVKGGKHAAKKQDVTSNESTDSLRNALIAEMSSLG